MKTSPHRWLSLKYDFRAGLPPISAHFPRIFRDAGETDLFGLVATQWPPGGLVPKSLC